MQSYYKSILKTRHLDSSSAIKSCILFWVHNITFPFLPPQLVYIHGTNSNVIKHQHRTTFSITFYCCKSSYLKNSFPRQSWESKLATCPTWIWSRLHPRRWFIHTRCRMPRCSRRSSKKLDQRRPQPKSRPSTSFQLSSPSSPTCSWADYPSSDIQANKTSLICSQKTTHFDVVNSIKIKRKKKEGGRSGIRCVNETTNNACIQGFSSMLLKNGMWRNDVGKLLWIKKIKKAFISSRISMWDEVKQELAIYYWSLMVE